MVINGRPTSFGPFQSHFPGIANQMLAAGIDVRDKSTVRAQIEWMKNYGHAHGGYSSDIWHGLRGHGGSIHSAPHIEPYRKTSHPTIIENTMFLDGEVVHRSVVSRIIHRTTHPTAAPLHNGMHSWTPPDSGLVGA